MNKEAEPIIYICSDAVGETAEAVVQATLRQFDATAASLRRIGHIKEEEEIIELLQQAARQKAFVVYTLVQPELREMMREEAIRQGVRAIDVMGPVMEAYMEVFNGSPKRKPGLLYQMDDLYFRRVEAMEFSVKCDDGRDTQSMLLADIVLIGVSRTSKTPLSIYLAHKGYKVANLPLVPEVKPPVELAHLASGQVIGLTMKAEQLLTIRTERLKSAGLPFGAKYATSARVMEELEYAERVMKSLHCPVIDVTNKAIEETAGLILDYLSSQNRNAALKKTSIIRQKEG
ncbi:pyruvate, water dikinase regulatory protein [Paenibacillus senegalensis]|uniref:pyruvate, water dikinase regulatory protein n=1 Tax=Paenibacillus senegalensis TaxID=1465766 RepID=UPI000287D4D2|nr:pyruvate, water dikinase regulatory protein [Paenibacillus senegalensis]